MSLISSKVCGASPSESLAAGFCPEAKRKITWDRSAFYSDFGETTSTLPVSTTATCVNGRSEAVRAHRRGRVVVLAMTMRRSHAVERARCWT